MDAKEKLIQATQELLWERGYVGTSPKAIQRRSGVGQGSMYHHFINKSDLALEAIRRSSEEMKSLAEEQFSGNRSSFERIQGYLARKREVLRGCRIGRLTQDPDIMADPVLRQPLEEAFSWLRKRLTEIIKEGQKNGELTGNMDAEDAAAMIAGVVQGGYVLAKAANSDEPFHRAVRGTLSLLNPQNNTLLRK